MAASTSHCIALVGLAVVSIIVAATVALEPSRQLSPNQAMWRTANRFSCQHRGGGWFQFQQCRAPTLVSVQVTEVSHST
eukprot:XP_001699291.1 predicted protein [Chlamydomonas reinhardtii]